MLKDWQCITVNVNAGIPSSMYVCMCVCIISRSVYCDETQAGQRLASSACAVLCVGSPALLQGREGLAGTLDITINFAWDIKKKPRNRVTAARNLNLLDVQNL